MLYLIYKKNHPELAYRWGQGPIVHLEADLSEVVAWANRNGRRWAFTLSNAGSYYFEDRCSLVQLEEVDWDAVGANHWSGYGTTHDSTMAWDLLDHPESWTWAPIALRISRRTHWELTLTFKSSSSWGSVSITKLECSPRIPVSRSFPPGARTPG